MKTERLGISLRIGVIQAVLLIWAAAQATAQENVLTPELAVGLKQVGEVALSPDGATIAYVLSVPRKADDEPGGSYSELWLIDSAGGAARRYTAEKGDASSPAWSPDGTTIAFLSRRDDQDAHRQIYLISPDGGEARKLTSHETSIASFVWSPDGSSIAFSARDAKSEERVTAEREGRDWVILGSDDLHTRLWIVDLETGAERRVYDEPLTTSNFVWTPDGKTLVFQAAESPATDDGYMYQRIYTTGLADESEPSVLCKTQGKLGAMSVSPDGSTLAFQGATSLNDPLAQSLYVVPMDGSESRNLTAGRESSVVGLEWIDDQSLVALTDVGTRTTLEWVRADGGESPNSPEMNAVIRSMSIAKGGNGFAVLASEAHQPEAVYAPSPNGDASLACLTNHNPELVGLELARQETIVWEGAGGWRIEGVLVWPVGYRQGTRYPLIVNPHGGPEGVSQEGFNVFAQLIAARGYFVLMPNYRGSGGRGVDFAKGDHNDLGGTEYEDILAGVDALIERGLVDGDHVGSAGWSYGGFLSAYAATHYSHRYKAAVMGAGISNWISFAGTTDIPHEMQIVHWNQWWQDDALIQWQRSPLSAIDKANTPTLILHGQDDARVHPEQALQMYQALRHRGVPVELVMYPRATHGVSERAHRLDILQRQLDWFDRYVRGNGQ